jgi:cell division protein FtsI/penicillin-binding protein 2
MANWPTYSPRDYGLVQDKNQYVNTAISWAYEPGSVFKPLTLAAALEARVIRPDDAYDDRGEIIVGGQRILNSDKKAHGRTTMTELLAYSRNVGAAHVATLLGPARFCEMIRRFGFGEITGVDLALEVPGSMRAPGSPIWHMSDLGTNSFGQGIDVTPLQVAAAYGALANDGWLMRPFVVSHVHDGKGLGAHKPVRVRPVISSQTSQQITKLMADAVELAFQEPLVPGYRFAAKSGTSQIPEQEGYQDKDVVASFVGFGPLPDPRFVILVKYDKPREGYWGSEVAAPAFSKLARYLVDYYGIASTQQQTAMGPSR